MVKAATALLLILLASQAHATPFPAFPGGKDPYLGYPVPNADPPAPVAPPVADPPPEKGKDKDGK